MPPRRVDPVVAAAIIAVTVLLVAGGLQLGAHLVARTVPSSVSRTEPAVVDVDAQLGYQGLELAGTGIVITPSGAVLTNNHVIESATKITVTDVGNHRSYQASVVGYDVSADIALLQLQGASGLKAAPLGDSSTVTVGSRVTAMGNAGGLGGTPSTARGTVVGLDQAVDAQNQIAGTSEHLTGLIATDAAIQSGDSGGPLIDANDQVIGMDTAGSSGFQFQPGGTEGFAIPINQALTVATRIRSGETGNGVHAGPTAFLGVDLAESPYYSGALIASVLAGTPAAAAGLEPGDLIVSLGGQTVDSPGTLSSLAQSYKPGEEVAIGWVDPYGASHAATVRLVAGPPA